jgi:hypothetical protein
MTILSGLSYGYIRRCSIKQKDLVFFFSAGRAFVFNDPVETVFGQRILSVPRPPCTRVSQLPGAGQAISIAERGVRNRFELSACSRSSHPRSNPGWWTNPTSSAAFFGHRPEIHFKDALPSLKVSSFHFSS